MLNRPIIPYLTLRKIKDVHVVKIEFKLVRVHLLLKPGKNQQLL